MGEQLAVYHNGPFTDWGGSAQLPGALYKLVDLYATGKVNAKYPISPREWSFTSAKNQKDLWRQENDSKLLELKSVVYNPNIN